MEELLFFISEGLEREYEDPANSVSYDSKEGGYLLPTQDTDDLLFEIGFDVESQELFDDIAGAFDCIWVKKDPYGPWEYEELQYTWQEFSDLVKHRMRYFFNDAVKSSEYEPEPATILNSISDTVNSLDLITELRKGTKIYRARAHKSSNKLNNTSSISAPPNKFACQSRFSPAGISMFYGALDEITEVDGVVWTILTWD